MEVPAGRRSWPSGVSYRGTRMLMTCDTKDPTILALSVGSETRRARLRFCVDCLWGEVVASTFSTIGYSSTHDFHVSHV